MVIEDLKFVYIDFESEGLDEKGMEKVKLRYGKINEERLFEVLFGHACNGTESGQFHAAVGEVLPNLTRCQRDLLAAEYGENETNYLNLIAATEVFQDPIESRVMKLKQALKMIAEEYQK